MENPPLSDSDSSSQTDTGESLSSIMQEFKEQMANIEEKTVNITSQITGLYAKAKEASVDWLDEPLIPTPALKSWLKQRGSTLHPTMDEFIDICYDAARTMDLESRVLTFSRADAAILWGGLRRLTVFDILGLIPSLFVTAPHP